VKAPDRSKLLAEALTMVSRADGSVTTLRANGSTTPLDAAGRAELLAKAVAREQVRLEIDVMSYEQETGKPNRNHVRFRDGAMIKLGATGQGNPYLRDHRQGDVTARGGTVLKSKTEKAGDGWYRINQTIEVTEPAAVERALRGLMSSVSIGWNPIGPVLCSACDEPVFESCWHWPGDMVQEGEDQRPVEWIFTDAELVETSEVSVPGVPSAGITGIRAALAALSGSRELPTIGDDESQEQDRMSTKLLTALAAALSLAPTVGESEVTAAVEELAAKNRTLTAQLGVAEGERARLSTEVTGYRATEAKHAEDGYIATALANGQIAPVDEPAWRLLFKADPKMAAAEMAKRPNGCSTPVGLSRQSDRKVTEDAGAMSPTLVAMMRDMGLTEAEARTALAKGGAL
jgi:hypothetical protein